MIRENSIVPASPSRAATGRHAGSVAARAIALLVGAWLSLAGSMALAADAVVISLAGGAVAEGSQPSPGTRALQRGSELFEGDLVRTGDDGRIQFRFTDGGLVSLQPRTEFRIDEYRHGGTNPRSFFSLLRGALRTATGAIGKRDHNDYRLRTPTATVGIRGTEYMAEETVCDPRCAPGPRAGLRVSVTQGRIAVTTAAGAIEVNEGQSAVVDSPDALPRLSAAGPTLAPRALGERSPAAGLVASAEAQAAGTSSSAIAQSSPPGSATSAADSSATAGAESPLIKTAHWTLSSGPSNSSAGEPPALVPAADEATSPNNDRGIDGKLAVVPVGPGNSGGTGPADPGNGTGSGKPGPGSGAGTAPGSGTGAGTSPGPASEAEPDTGDPGSDDPDPDAPGTVDPGDGDPGSGDPGTGNPGTPAPLSGPGTIGAARTVVLQNLPAQQPFDWRQLTQPGRGYVLDAQGLVSIGLDANGDCPLAVCLSRGTIRVEDGNADAYVAWGRWTGGKMQVDGPLASAIHQSDRTLSANEGLHYLIGVPSTTVPTSGEFSYTLLGATRPTFSDGRGSPGVFTGQAGVAFAPGQASIGLEGQVTIGGNAYAFTTSGGAARPSLSGLTTNAGAGYAFSGSSSPLGSGPLSCNAGACSVSVEGGLFGPEAARLGVGYRIGGTGTGSTISGVGVFQKQ